MEFLILTSRLLLWAMVAVIYYGVKISWLIIKWPLKITILILIFIFYFVLIGFPVKILSSIYYKAGGQLHPEETSIFDDMKEYILSSFRFLTGKEKEVEDVDDEDEDDEEEIENDKFSFVQRFALDKNTSLLIDHVEYCPDETAFIRIVSEDDYSKLYKRKVYRDKRDGRYIKHNENKWYLDDKVTQPIVVR